MAANNNTINIKIVVAGQPNTGKSLLINKLTGAQLRVGNFPGITIDKVEISIKIKNYILTFIDLPGIYSLEPVSDDERVATDFLANCQNEYDIILNITNALQIERDLRLTYKLIKTYNKPLLLAFNMIDELHHQNYTINSELLKENTSLPFIEVSAKNGEGIAQMAEKIIEIYENSLKNDNQTTTITQNKPYLSIETLKKVITKDYSKKNPFAWTEFLDNIFIHKYFGLPLFAMIICGIFHTTFTVGSIPAEWIEMFGSFLSKKLQVLLPHNIISSMLYDGIIPGVFTVLSFLPLIVILFTFITILEKTD